MVPSRTLIKEDGVTVQTPSHRIEFQNGIYETDDKKEIEYIKTRMRLNGNIIEISPEEQETIKERVEEEKEVREEVKKRRAKKKK